MMKIPLALVSALVCGVALHASAASHEEFRRERDTIEADYARRTESCKKQFVVTSCLDKARVERQKALNRVSEHESALNATERGARAESRRQRLAEKAAAAGEAASAAPVAKAASAASAPAPKTPKIHKKQPAALQDRSAREEGKRVEYEARQREIEAHREMVEKRNAERARHKPAPRPLPTPASAGT